MILTIDIGNSNIVIGTPQGKTFAVHRYRTDILKSSDEYYALLKHHFDGAEGVAISSVVPPLNDVFHTFISQYIDVPLIWVGPGVKTGVKVVTENPKEVGADLVAVAAGAIAHYSDDAILIDCGTATTITHLKQREIKGVAIAIGLDSSRDCLVAKASKLSSFAFEVPKTILGNTTQSALNTGFINGHVYMLKGFVEALRKEEQNPTLKVLVTGGGARLLSSLFPEDYLVDSTLIFKGLHAIYQKNV